MEQKNIFVKPMPENSPNLMEKINLRDLNPHIEWDRLKKHKGEVPEPDSLRVPGQPRLYSVTLSQKKLMKTKINNKNILGTKKRKKGGNLY